MIPASPGFLRFVSAYTAILGPVLPLALIRLGKTVAQRTSKTQTGFS
ncbi:hypothetical protein BJG92_01524 [Arthrobacter sp. SO5]|nr:hypothetical protein [Arthrobacter sp. SO5]